MRVAAAIYLALALIAFALFVPTDMKVWAGATIFTWLLLSEAWKMVTNK